MGRELSLLVIYITPEVYTVRTEFMFHFTVHDYFVEPDDANWLVLSERYNCMSTGYGWYLLFQGGRITLFFFCVFFDFPGWGTRTTIDVTCVNVVKNWVLPLSSWLFPLNQTRIPSIQ